MTMNMNVKGRQTKLLAVIAILAMVVCAFAIVMPATSDAVTIDADDESLKTLNSSSPATTIEAGKTYVIDGDVSITITMIAITDSQVAPTFLMLPESSFTLTGANVSGTAIVYAATAMNGEDEQAEEIVSYTYTAGTGIEFASVNSATVELTNTDGVITGDATGTILEPTNAISYYNMDEPRNYMLSVPTAGIELTDGETYTIPAGYEMTGKFIGYTGAGDTKSVKSVIDMNGVVFDESVTVTTTSGVITLAGKSTATVSEGMITVAQGTMNKLVSLTVTGHMTAVRDNNGITYPSISEAVANKATALKILGDYSASGEDVTLTSTLTTVTFDEGSSYSGTIIAGETSIEVSIDKVADGETVVFTYTAPTLSDTEVTTLGKLKMTGGTAKMSASTDGYVIGSNVVISGIENETIGNNSAGVAQFNTIELGTVAFDTMNLDTPVKVAANSVVPSSSTLTFDNTKAIITGATSDVAFYVLGKLMGTAATMFSNVTMNALDPTAVGYYYSGDITDLSEKQNRLSYDGTAASAEAIIAALNDAEPGTKYIIDGTTSGLTLYLWGEVNLADVTIYLASNANDNVTVNNPVDVQVGRPAGANGTGSSAWTGDYATAANASLIMDEVTIYGQNPDKGIYVNKGSAFNTTDSLLYVMVTSAEGSSVNLDNGEASYTETTSNISVGAGMTLTLNGSVRNLVDVYGDLIINEGATIDNKRTMTVYPGASVTINGSMTVLGTAYFMAGSEATVNGTVTVGNNNGGALLDVDGDFTVSADGTVSVSSVRSGDANKNRLNAPDSDYTPDSETPSIGEYPYMFVVEGTLNANGMLAGYIHDQGTVSISGFQDTNTSAASNAAPDHATIVIYDGISLKVDSFLGTLNITDEGIADELVTAPGVMKVSDNNNVALLNATNVTVTTAVNDVPWTKDDGTGHVDYYTVMTISGNPGIASGADNAKITIGATGSNAVGEKGEYAAHTEISAETTMEFGANVSLAVNGILDVYGKIEFLDQSVGSTDDLKKLSGSGASAEITVYGQIAVSDKFSTYSGTMNAVMYTVTVTGSDASITDYYVSFAAAVAVTDADEDTITVMGKITAEGEITIPAGMVILFDSNAVLTVDSDAELIVTDSASVEGPNNASIVVKGILTSQDYLNDMKLSKIVAEVVITDAPARTWTSLAGAIAMGETDITANGIINIEEDLTIPEGTTVDTEYDVNVKDEAVLTVDGELIIDDANLNIDTDAEVAVNGVVSITNLSEDEPAGISDIDGAHYGLSNGAYVTHYVSNLAIASEKTTETTSLVDSTVYIVGTVSAQDVTFKSAKTGQIIIDLAGVAADETNGIEAHPAILAMGTLTFNGSVKIQVGAYPDEMFTGTIAAPCGDGTTNASIVLTRASGFTYAASFQYGVETTYYATLTGNGITGDMDISAGTVTLGTVKLGKDATFDVASGATIVLPSGTNAGSLNATDGNGKTIADVTVAGTINIQNGNGITGDITVSGTVNVTDRTTFNPAGIVTLTGTINVKENSLMVVDQRMIVGDAPETLGVGGALAGSYRIDSPGYIVAYAGADLGQAKINWNSALGQSDAQSTVYYINETEYATVYANGEVYINGFFGVNAETNPAGYIEIQLTGLNTNIYDDNGKTQTNTVYTWYNADDKKATGLIGSDDAVYIEFDIAEVTGTVSKDAGIILTIDSLVVGYSNGDVSQTVQYLLGVGTHTISWSERTGYDISGVTVSFNGVEVQNGGTITITADMTTFTIIAEGAVPGAAPSGDTTTSDDGMGLTDYLLIILVVLIVVMAIMVALRLMRS